MSDQIILAIIVAGQVVIVEGIRRVNNKVKACGDLSCRTAINAAVKKSRQDPAGNNADLAHEAISDG